MKNNCFLKLRNYAILGIALSFGMNTLNAQETNTAKDLNLKGKVKNVRVYYSEVQDRFGIPEKDGKMEYPRWVYLFDNKGNVIEHNSYEKSGKLIERNTTEFNKENQSVNAAQYNSGGVLDFYYTFQYYKGLLTETSKYNVDGELVSKTNFQYDDQNRVIEEAVYLPNTKLKSQSTFNYAEDKNTVQKNSYDGPRLASVLTTDYDEKGQKIGERNNKYHKDQEVLDYIITYERDRSGNVLKEVKYKGTGNVEYTNTYKYTFDKKGNWIKRTQYSTNIEIPTIVEDRIIEYYSL